MASAASPKDHIALLKELASLGTAILPYLSTKYPVIPFLNPQITEDMWLVSAILAATSGFLAHRICGWAKEIRDVRWSFVPVSGALIAASCVVVMVGLAEEIWLKEAPALQQFAVRVVYLVAFAALAVAIGGGLGLSGRLRNVGQPRAETDAAK